MQLSPVLAELEQYPFTRLDDWRAGRTVIDFGVGDPREVTPLFIREALAAAIEERSSYPRAAGLPELRRVGDFEVQPKQAWTNVADFAARGLDAVNFGPGATRFAHAVDERVEIEALGRAFAALQRFLLGGS